MQATSRSPGKSGEVISARSWVSNKVSCRSPSPDQLLDLGGAQRGDPVQARGPDVLAQPRGGQLPRSPTRTTWLMPNRSLTLSTWLATVFGSPVFPANTSIATGMPSLPVSSP